MITPAFPTVQTYDLPRVDVPEEIVWWPSIDATMISGVESVRNAVENTLLSQQPQRIALDIETHGTGHGRWSITCATVAWRGPTGDMATALFDPLRVPSQGVLLRDVLRHSSSILLHNAVFDIPPLYSHGLMGMDEINKVEDTIILSRMVRTLRRGGRTLDELSQHYDLVFDGSVKITTAMKAAGFATKDAGYEQCDIDRDFYRRGAMSDTAVTLRLWEPLYADVMRMITRGTYGGNTVAWLDQDRAHQLIADMMQMLRITLRRSARGLALDRDFIAKWREDSAPEIERQSAYLESAGVRPGVGADVIKLLEERGELPDDWPRTDKGALKSDKKAMDLLTKVGHPLTSAHTVVAEHNKNNTYLEQLETAAWATGRVHPSVGVLGAHASGRMSVTDPPIQQFSEEVRPAIVTDDGRSMWSADWSSIEPVVLANCAGDADFLAGFNSGQDIYIPVAKAAGLIPAHLDDKAARAHPGRDQAKVVLLAGMYGQGLRSLSESLGMTIDQAKTLQNRLRANMQATFNFMDRIEQNCARTGVSFTISGRVLDERLPNDEIVSRVAVNHFCQGSSADILMAATLQLERWGMADEILMWIHDEIVSTDDGKEAVVEAMRTPPEWLLQNTSLTPVLLVDAQDMGRSWQKV